MSFPRALWNDRVIHVGNSFSYEKGQKSGIRSAPTEILIYGMMNVRKKDRIMSIYEDLYMARCGDPYAFESITEECKPLIVRMAYDACDSIVSLRYIREDVIQEGLICLNDAVAKYRPDRDASFKTFVRVLFDRKIKNILRGERVQKAIPQECLVSMDREITERKETLMVKLEQRDCFADPEFVLAYHEAENALNQKVEDMNGKERKYLGHWYDRVSTKNGALAMKCSGRTYTLHMRNVKEQVISAVYSG